MLLQQKKVAIIGGGPGGLTLARLLQLKGASVHVYERDEHRGVRVQGATLDLHEESGLEALRRAGLIDAFRQHYRPGAGRMRVADAHARIVWDDHEHDRFEDSRPEIDRGPLRTILLDAIEPGTVVWDRCFSHMEPAGDGWTLHFRNGTTASADVVIAADGANSRIRPYLTGITPVYSGVTIVEGNVYHAAANAPRLYELLKGGKLFAFGGSQSLILSAKGDGSLSFYTGCKVPESWVQDCGIDFRDTQSVAHWFKQAFGQWDDVWLELFAADEVSFIPRPQYHFPLDQHWDSQANLTLLGDAAHRMPPYAGEGVNMAMQDAYELAGCLTNDRFQTVREAISAYEAGMLKRASAVTQMTLEQTEQLHAPDAIGHMLQLFGGQ